MPAVRLVPRSGSDPPAIWRDLRPARLRAWRGRDGRSNRWFPPWRSARSNFASGTCAALPKVFDFDQHARGSIAGFAPPNTRQVGRLALRKGAERTEQQENESESAQSVPLRRRRPSCARLGWQAKGPAPLGAGNPRSVSRSLFTALPGLPGGLPSSGGWRRGGGRGGGVPALPKGTSANTLWSRRLREKSTCRRRGGPRR